MRMQFSVNILASYSRNFDHQINGQYCTILHSSDQRSILYNSQFIKSAVNTVQFFIHQTSDQYFTILNSSDQRPVLYNSPFIRPTQKKIMRNKSALQAYLFVISFAKTQFAARRRHNALLHSHRHAAT